MSAQVAGPPRQERSAQEQRARDQLGRDQLAQDQAALAHQQPFVVVPEWVLDLDLSDAAFRLYVVLLRFGGASGARLPSRGVLAARLRARSADAVDRALNELVALGAVTPVGGAGQPDERPRYVVETTSATSAACGAGSTTARLTTARSTTAGSTTARSTTARPRCEPTETATAADGSVTTPRSPRPPGVAQKRPVPATALTDVLARVDVEAVAESCRSIRQRRKLSAAGWSRDAVEVALRSAVVELRRPVTVAVEALFSLAADPHGRGPNQLTSAGAWWDAPRRVPELTGPQKAELAALETQLVEAGDRRIWALRRAREQVMAAGEAVSRLTLARAACDVLASGDDRGRC